MHSSRINGEGKLREQPAKPGSPEKWPLKQYMYSYKLHAS